MFWSMAARVLSIFSTRRKSFTGSRPVLAVKSWRQNTSWLVRVAEAKSLRLEYFWASFSLWESEARQTSRANFLAVFKFSAEGLRFDPKWITWQRETMVASKLWEFGADKTMVEWAGGSSRVFKRAFWAGRVRRSALKIKTALFWPKALRVKKLVSWRTLAMPMTVSGSMIMMSGPETRGSFKRSFILFCLSVGVPPVTRIEWSMVY